MTVDAIDTFLDAVRAGAIQDTDIYAADAVLDATVPGWRSRTIGPDHIKTEYAKWFAHPATFVELERIQVADGEVVTYELEWFEDGVRHRGHHAHRFVIATGKIVHDKVWCGGRWSAPVLRLMAEKSPGL